METSPEKGQAGFDATMLGFHQAKPKYGKRKKVVSLRQKSQLTIPSEMMKLLDFHQGDLLDVSVQGSRIVIERHEFVSPANDGWLTPEILSEIDDAFNSGVQIYDSPAEAKRALFG